MEQESNMRGTEMTEYVFEVKGKVTVTLHGRDTEDNYQKAIDAAIRQVVREIDHDWFDYVTAEEYTDYDSEYRAEKEAV